MSLQIYTGVEGHSGPGFGLNKKPAEGYSDPDWIQSEGLPALDLACLGQRVGWPGQGSRELVLMLYRK